MSHEICDLGCDSCRKGNFNNSHTFKNKTGIKITVVTYVICVLFDFRIFQKKSIFRKEHYMTHWNIWDYLGDIQNI